MEINYMLLFQIYLLGAFVAFPIVMPGMTLNDKTIIDFVASGTAALIMSVFSWGAVLYQFASWIERALRK